MAQPGGDMPDMQQILQQAQQMQEQLANAQAELAETEVSGSSGGGLVRVVVTGGLEIKDLSIDPSVVDPNDTETLSDLVIAAVRDGMSAAQQLTEDKLGPLAGGLGGGALGEPGGNPGLPGSPA